MARAPLANDIIAIATSFSGNAPYILRNTNKFYLAAQTLFVSRIVLMQGSFDYFLSTRILLGAPCADALFDLRLSIDGPSFLSSLSCN